jgi:hypothetical protein
MKKMTEKVPAPWELESNQVKKPKMLVVHMNTGEIEALDNLQGGPSIDPETGIREYHALASIIDNPKLIELFQNVSHEIKEKGNESPEVQNALSIARGRTPRAKPTPAEKHNPIHSLEDMGRKGDTKLALIPENLARFLISLMGKPSVNPKTGLLEFFWPIALSALSIGADLWKHGDDMDESRENRESAERRDLRRREEYLMDREYEKEEKRIAKEEKKIEKEETKRELARLTQLAKEGSEFQYKRDKEDYEAEKKQYDEKVKDYKKRHLLEGNLLKLKGIKSALNPKALERTPEEIKHGIMPHKIYLDDEDSYAQGGHVQSYKKGALVRGPGKGQDDKIKTSVPDGSYIIDASSTSMLGDGSTQAGSDILKQMELQIKKKFPQHFRSAVEQSVKSNAQQVPVWLSEGEHKIDPVTVTLLGKGSNDRGAKLLKQMVIKLRKHKISKGDQLPPKAKHPFDYIPKKAF